jgi:ferredoxin-NADP reductase
MAVETSAIVQKVISRTPSVKSFRVAPEIFSDFMAGQWLFVKIKTSSGEIQKPLSLSNAPTEKGFLEFTKKISSSDFSKALDGLVPGDRLTVKYPQGSFVFKNDVKKIAFLSGGIGITPIRSICRDITDRALGTDMVLLYGNNSEEEIAFREDFDQMQSRSARFKVLHVLCKACAEWRGRTGFITDAMIREEIPDYMERRFYLCGPPPMIEGIQKILLGQCGFPKEQLVTEGFAGYA